MHNQDQKKIALITGANKGIGLESARQLARDHGHTVLIGARDKTRGENATAKLRAEGLDVQFLEIDPTDDASVTAAAKEVESCFETLALCWRKNIPCRLRRFPSRRSRRLMPSTCSGWHG